MNEDQEADIRRALDNSHDQVLVRFLLRRVLGEETQLKEINGHLLKRNPTGGNLDDWCQVQGCEMSDEKYADRIDCPTNAEGMDRFYTNI